MAHGEPSEPGTPAVEEADPRSPAGRRQSRRRPAMFIGVVVAILLLLFGLPLWQLVFLGAHWPAAGVAIGTAILCLAGLALPVLMYLGHSRRQLDWAARAGDTILGAIWILFVWTILGNVLRIALAVGGVVDPARSRIVTVTVLVVVAVLLVWGYVEAMRVPRIRPVDITIPGLGQGLDGTQIAVLTDTHYGPINRARWSANMVAAVNRLEPDVVCHVGDIADGTVAMRLAQAAPLGDVRARLARVYVTGNHEYFGEPQGWLDHMRDLGWEPLHNRHLVVERGGDRLVLAGVDDVTAASSGRPGHKADLSAALAGADRDLPVVLLAHQPRQVEQAVQADVDLQISGHTHGGQIWPFHYLVLLDQPSVQGLTRHGARTQLYTSRGSGFWGPPFRVFAPSEISLLTLRSA